MDYMEKYKYWCETPCIDEETKKIVKSLSEVEIKESFYKDLEFGTGGLRGVMGPGSNRMNIYTIRKATQGLANYILKAQTQEKGVAIAYDSRNNSPLFAKETALVFAANGIKAYLFDSLRPTPELSFALRTLHCTAGVVITASHNPKKYNGYKVYWTDGAQITPPRDQEIIDEVNQVTQLEQIKTVSEEEAIAKGLLTMIGSDMDTAYIDTIKQYAFHPEYEQKEAADLKIVYTPLHGTGNLPVRRVLQELGYSQVYIVKEQETPDGDFPTVDYPNPEDKKAFTLALKLAEEVKADIILATDPDADRLGVYAFNKRTHSYEPFTGNMSGTLIGEYILSERKKNNVLPQNSAVVTTIVTTNMIDAVAKNYNVKVLEVLTGFKYIGEQIKWFEENHTYEYIFGLEESYGCLVGTYARDKDAVSAVMTLCEAAASLKKEGLTLWDKMFELYEKYGYYKEDLETMTLEGMDGAKKIQAMMERLRNHPLQKAGSFDVLAIRDYEKGNTGLPKSNVLYYELSDNGWFAVRPSGTEPKIKLYFGVKGTNASDASDKLEQLKQDIRSLVME